MAEIIISNDVDNYLSDLVDILYKEEHFGFRIEAKDYVDRLYDFIYTIPLLPFKTTKNKLYGSYYCTYKHSYNTSWYITFDIEDEIYLIINIANNHSRDYAEFVGNLI